MLIISFCNYTYIIIFSVHKRFNFTNKTLLFIPKIFSIFKIELSRLQKFLTDGNVPLEPKKCYI